MTTAETTWSDLPLSAEQEGLLYLHRMEPESARYLVPVAFEITGELDVAALEGALAALVHRHPVLTAVPADSSLDADPRRPLPLTHRKAPGVLGREAVDLLRSEATAPMDPDSTGMARALLVTAAPERAYLLLVVHHAVFDGESSGVLVRDLWRFYRAERNGVPVDTQPLPARIYTSCDRSRQQLSHQESERLRAYWRGVLADTPPMVELPADGATDGPHSAAVPIELPAETVTAFARRHRVGGSALLLAAYQRTLARYAGRQRVLVAVPVNTRNDPQLDEAVGCFVTTVLVRSQPFEGQSVSEHVRAVQAEMARAVDHSQLPYRQIAELSDTDEGFNCVFSYQSWYGRGVFGDSPPELHIRLLEEIQQPVVGDLTLEMLADDDRLRGQLRYALDRFAPETAEAFAAQLTSTVRAMAEDADAPIDALADVAARSDRTDRPLDHGSDVDRLFREAVERFADRVALEEGDRAWTYRELDEQVSRIAAGLRAQGVNPGDRVGLLMRRGAGQVLAVLAVLRAGSIFVPLDPSHPDRRLEDLVGRANLALIVREADDRVTPTGARGVELADLAGDHPFVEFCHRAAEPAYVLFTSGSTGAPKGVVVAHRALVNHLEWARRYFSVTPDDVMAFSGTLSFDVTLHQLFLPLVSGARLAVVPEGEQRDADAMARTLRRHGATLLHVVPALLRGLTDSPDFADVATLRSVVSAGEPLTNHLRQAFERVQDAALYNAYGPTEATIYATVFDASTASGQRWTAQADVPIGEPLDNIRCHVLDERMRPVPRGAPGELCLAGEALALGYLDDPQRTAERFCEVSIAGSHERIYRTGDLVRELPAGGLYYLGRIDRQVKLNGFRVELGEVEAALLSVPGVEEAVAAVRRRDDGHPRLVGYVTPAGIDTGKAHAMLTERLPGYMVPSRIVTMHEFPRLPSGKTDRDALPEPAAQHLPTPAEPRAAPASAVVEAVRTAWTEVLGQPPASDDAHFFESGGDSILAMRLVAALRRAGVALDVRVLHRHPVLRELAGALDTDPAVPRRAADVPRAALAPIQSWFFDTVRTDRHHWNQSVLLEPVRPVDPTLLGMALQAVVAAHPLLSARVSADGIDELPPFTVEEPRDLLDCVAVDSDQARDEAIRQAQRSLAPENGVMVRARHLYDRAAGSETLLIVVHHLVVDGVSWHVLLDDLARALDSLEQGELPRLPEEGHAYQAWMANLPELAQDESTVSYWRSVARRRRNADVLLRSAPATLEGQTRRVETEVAEEVGAELLGTLPAALELPVHDLLTGCVALALARWRGCETVSFDVETHGRQAAGEDLSRTVGWFTALYPVTLDVDRRLTPADHLRSVRGELAAVPDGGVGFGACRIHACDASVREELAELPPSLVCFNYLGRIDSDSAGERFRIVDGRVPEARSSRAERPHTVEIYGLVRDGRLRLGITWAPSEIDGVDRETVNALLAQLRTVVTTLVSETRSAPDEVPLTPQQYGILVDSLSAREADRYVEQMSWLWHGPLHIDRFTEAWRHTMRRHTALRASFAWDGTPRLVVHSDIEPQVRVRTDVSWEDLLTEDRQRGFDLGRPCLWRVSVVPEGESRHRILLSFHHALLDGWSTAVVLEDFYLAYLGRPRPYDPTEPDIRTHARWIAARDPAEAQEFWSTRLSGREPGIRPGVTGAVESEQGYGRSELRCKLGDLARVRAEAARAAATDSTLYQAVWAMLLWRFTGGGTPHDVSFGVTLSGRGVQVPGVERVAGLLMSTLPLTVDVHPEKTVLDLVRQVRDTALEVSAFEWASTGQVHDWSGRSGSSPLFESLIVVENYPSTLGEVGQLLADAGVTVELPRVVGARTAYPCTMLLHHEEDELVLTLVHDRSTVPSAAAERIVDLWRRVLLQLGENGQATVGDLVGGLGDDLLPVLAPRREVRADDARAKWPDTPYTQPVKDVWCHVLGVDDVAPTDHFFAVGGHSLAAVRFLHQIGERCGVDVPLDDLLTHPTAAAFAAVVRECAHGRTDRSPLVSLRPGREPVVYLIHPPGGHVACYSELARSYAGPEEIVGVRDPRVDEPGEPRNRTVRELAEEYHALLAPRLENAPAVLGGYSGGGVIAQETARLVHQSTGHAPLVLMIDAAAPNGHTTDTAAEGSFLRQVMAYDRAATRESPEYAADYLDELAAVAGWMEGSGQADPYELLATTLTAVEAHHPEHYPGPVAVVRASETDFGRGSDFDAAADYYRSPALGWEGRCDELSVHFAPGNHVSLLTGENAAALARIIADLVQQHRRRE
ncbi:amino acid adenylation domain-containing protein [Salinactinospora qingdaonensis]|uniref:Carrier domain-containing protein n=1 Tax=Salinactinospora qingdaonensis TaxID=702744 RepID=A0ABP7G419_9ACTN